MSNFITMKKKRGIQKQLDDDMSDVDIDTTTTTANNNDIDNTDEYSLRMKQSKEWVQVKCAARETLEQSGWVDAVRHSCLHMNSNDGIGVPKQASLVARVQADAKTRVPDHIKADILGKIKSLLQHRCSSSGKPGDGDERL